MRLTDLGRCGLCAGVLSIALDATGIVQAQAQVQAQGVHKTTLQSMPFPDHGEHTVLVRTVVDPGRQVALHSHPGLELAYIVSGRAHVHVQGRPDAELGPGGSFAAPPDTPHAVGNIGRDPLVIVSTYVVDPTKPIATPVAGR